MLHDPPLPPLKAYHIYKILFRSHQCKSSGDAEHFTRQTHQFRKTCSLFSECQGGGGALDQRYALNSSWLHSVVYLQFYSHFLDRISFSNLCTCSLYFIAFRCDKKCISFFPLERQTHRQTDV